MEENDVLISQLEEEDLKNRNVSVNYYLIDSIISKLGLNQISEYILAKNICNIIIYGGGVVGNIFFNQLKNISNIKVVAIVDKRLNLDFDFNDVNIICADNINNFDYDIIIVTPIVSYYDIKKFLESKKAKNIVPISDIFKTQYLYF